MNVVYPWGPAARARELPRFEGALAIPHEVPPGATELAPGPRDARPVVAAGEPLGPRLEAPDLPVGRAGHLGEAIEVRVDAGELDALVHGSRDDACLRFLVAEALAQVGQPAVEGGAIGARRAARQPSLEDRSGEAVVGGPRRRVQHRFPHRLRLRAEHVEGPPRDHRGPVRVALRELPQGMGERLREPRRRLRLREEPRQRVAEALRVPRREESIDQPAHGRTIAGAERDAALAPSHRQLRFAQRCEGAGQCVAPGHTRTGERHGPLQSGCRAPVRVLEDGLGQGRNAAYVRRIRLGRALGHAPRLRPVARGDVAIRRDGEEHGGQRRRGGPSEPLERHRLRVTITSERRGDPLARDHRDPRIAFRQRAPATLSGERALSGCRCLRGRVCRERPRVRGVGAYIVGEGTRAEPSELQEVHRALRQRPGSSAADLEPGGDDVEKAGLDEQRVEGLAVHTVDGPVEPVIERLGERLHGRPLGATLGQPLAPALSSIRGPARVDGGDGPKMRVRRLVGGPLPASRLERGPQGPCHRIARRVEGEGAP